MLIRGQPDIDIQISDEGYICIKQYDPAGSEHVIQFAPAYAPKISGAITDLQEFAQKKFEKYQPEEV